MRPFYLYSLWNMFRKIELGFHVDSVQYWRLYDDDYKEAQVISVPYKGKRYDEEIAVIQFYDASGDAVENLAVYLVDKGYSLKMTLELIDYLDSIVPELNFGFKYSQELIRKMRKMEILQ